MTEPNIYKQRLEETLATVKANLEHWDQRDWETEHECGSSYCFIGWGVNSLYGHEQAPHEEQMTVMKRHGINGYRDFTREFYGLDVHEHLRLCCPDNTIEDLERIVGSLHND